MLCCAVLCCIMVSHIIQHNTIHTSLILNLHSCLISRFPILTSVCVFFFFLVLRFQIDKQAKKEHARRGEKAREKDKEAKSKMENGKMVKW